MAIFREWARSAADGAKRFGQAAGEKMREFEARGIKAAGQAAWYPAGFLLEAYKLPGQMQFRSAKQGELLQALTAAELGKQVHEPVLQYIIEQARALPKALPSSGESTAVVPFASRRSTQVQASDAALALLGGLTTHLVRSASIRFEEMLPAIIHDDASLSDAEKKEFEGELPRLKEVARRFVGLVSGDAKDVLTAKDENAIGRIVGRHVQGIDTIDQDYHRQKNQTTS